MTKPTDEVKSNKLNIYLVKDKFIDEDAITKISEDNIIKKIVLPDIGVLYYKRSFTSPPDWLSTFFRNHNSIDPKLFFGSGAKAVLIVRIPHRGKNRFFAIPFGSGRFLLRDYCYEERFGLITSLNILESKSIRGIDKRTLSTNPKISREQIARASDAIDFQIDFERDLVQSITGRSLDASFGNIITGKEALSVSAKIDITNIKDFLKKSLSTFEKKDYQTNFKWIDQIKEIKIQDTIDKLNEKLIKKIKEKDDMVWLAVPEIIDWTDFKGFKYSTRKKDALYDELELKAMEAEVGRHINAIEDLQNTSISYWGISDDNHPIDKWSAFACLNAEIDIGKKKYFLSNSKWYEINSEFVASVNNAFNEVKQIDLKLPDYNHAKEGDYNTAAAKHIKALCLDAKNLPYGGGHSKIEFCDILTKDKKLIHVKKYGGSAVLSHLFAQGFVSAELLLMDEAFRQKVIDELLPAEYKKVVPAKKPKASDFKIIYAIITNQKKKLSIPFFSKVVLKNNKKILEAYGFEIYLSKIQNIKDDSIEEDND